MSREQELFKEFEKEIPTLSKIMGKYGIDVSGFTDYRAGTAALIVMLHERICALEDAASQSKP